MTERTKGLEKRLLERSDKEAQDIESILLELKRSIEAELDEPEYRQLELFSDPERDQFERNKDFLRDRVKQIPAEIERETAAIRARFADPQARMFPVAVTFLVPRRLAQERSSVMGQIQETSLDPMRKLLRQVVRDRFTDLDSILSPLAPICRLDRDEDRICFQAINGTPNVIRIGVKCTVRLQAHAYASGIIITALSTPNLLNSVTPIAKSCYPLLTAFSPGLSAEISKLG